MDSSASVYIETAEGGRTKHQKPDSRVEFRSNERNE